MTRPRQAGSSASAASTQNLWYNLVNTIWNKKIFNLNHFFVKPTFTKKKKFREIDFTKNMIDANCCTQALMLRMAVIYIVVNIIYTGAEVL